jgi:hypothetical protein
VDVGFWGGVIPGNAGNLQEMVKAGVPGSTSTLLTPIAGVGGEHGGTAGIAGPNWLEQRDYREVWPLLTVETEVTGNSKSTNESGSSLVGSLGLSSRYKRFFSALTAVVGPVQNIFFLAL